MIEKIKPIVFTRHALERCVGRGTTEAEVTNAIRAGRREPAQRGLWEYRRNLEYQQQWTGKWYAVQQVVAIVEERADRLVVVTVYTFYF